MPPNYHIDLQPQLAEATVLRAVAGHAEAKLFWRERERLYEDGDRDDREPAFQAFHERWFNRLGLVQPLLQVFALWPILTSATSRCLLTQARTQKTIGADLFITVEEPELADRERRTIVVQLMPDLLLQSQAFLEFLRHELLHIVDMLDSRFGYEPNFPKSDVGPAYDHLLLGRYSVLWDIIIDGRLYRSGWLPPSAREKHFASFRRAFHGSEENLSATFAQFFEKNLHTHRELIEFARHPEKWLAGERVESMAKGRCAICHFPTFQLMDGSELGSDLIAKIQEHYPEWHPSQFICQQCADLYEAMSSNHSMPP
jgi:hypothetical protein